MRSFYVALNWELEDVIYSLFTIEQNLAVTTWLLRHGCYKVHVAVATWPLQHGVICVYYHTKI